MPTIHEAYIARSIHEDGLGEVYILRKKSPLKVEVGVFLVDTYCLGVRDAFFFEKTEAEVNELVAESSMPLGSMSVGYARKFIEESVAYAKQFGFAPHKGYKKAARAWGGVRADARLDDFTFGKDGKPCYIQSQQHSESDTRRILGKLTRACGEDGFLFFGAEEEDSEEFDDGIEERILLSEGWFDDVSKAEELLKDKPSEAARCKYLEFVDQEEFVGDPIFDNPIWETPDGNTNFDCLFEVTKTISDAAPEDYKSDSSEIRPLIFSFVILLMNLYHEDEESVEKHFKTLVENKTIPDGSVSFLRELRNSEEMQTILETLIHPSPSVTVRPMKVEVLDEENGHCLLICMEHISPED